MAESGTIFGFHRDIDVAGKKQATFSGLREKTRRHELRAPRPYGSFILTGRRCPNLRLGFHADTGYLRLSWNQLRVVQVPGSTRKQLVTEKIVYNLGAAGLVRHRQEIFARPMGKRKPEDELESEEEEEDDNDVVEFSGEEEEDDDDDGEEESESGEEDDEDDDDEGDDEDDDEEGSGSELDDEEDDSQSDFEEGISGSDIDDSIQDDEFEGVSGSDVSDGEPESSGGAEDNAEDGKEKGKERGQKDEEKGGIGSAFSRAFTNIMNKKVPKSELTDSLGPVLAERKQLLVRKLEEEANERKKKTDIKKKKREERERGHSIPQTYTDAKEKALIKLATTGVVRLFNAVSKAQKVQADADISSSKAAKATWKQSKQAFMSQLRGAPKDEKKPVGGPEKIEEEEEAGWAALRNDFMLGSSKMKDWDKNPEDVAV